MNRILDIDELAPRGANLRAAMVTETYPPEVNGVARTIGHLAGRLQRYVNDVKADISREMEFDELRKMRQFMTGLRKYVEENAENVGRDFPEEARKIHYGETEERPIYGEASLDEAKELIEEGVNVAPLPPDLDEAAN